MAAAIPPINEVFKVSSSAGFSHDLHQTLYTYQQQAHLTDFTIHVQGTQIHCHRVILSAASPYFEAMLRAGLEEAEKSEVNLDCLDKKILKDLIKYFYTGELKVPYNKLKDLMSACEYLQLQILKIHLEKYLIGILDDENCIGWFKVAGTYGMDDLMEKATDRMLNNFLSVCKKSEFMDLSLAEVLDYIRKKKAQIHSEDGLLDACVTWVTADLKDRKASFNDILSNVSLDKCSVKQLATVAEEQRELLNECKLFENLLKAFKDIAIKYEGPLYDISNGEHACICLFGGDVGDKKANRNINIYLDYKWHNLCNLPTDPCSTDTSMCLLKGELIVTGGTKTTGKCFSFNFNQRSWIELPDMPSARIAHTSQCIGQFVYVLGGWNVGEVFTMPTDVLYLSTRKWLTKKDMVHGVYSPITVHNSESIYVIQNSNGGNRQTVNEYGITLQIYDTTYDRWRFGAPLTDLVSSTRGACAVLHKDDILLLGGEDMIGASYSIKANTWTVFSKQCNASRVHMYGSAVVRDNKVLVLGGSSNPNNAQNSQDNSVSEFDLGSHTWKVSSMTIPLAVSFHTAVSVPLLFLK